MSLVKKTITKTKLSIKIFFLSWQHLVETTEDAESAGTLKRKSASQPCWPCVMRSAEWLGLSGAAVLQGGPRSSASHTQGPDGITLGPPAPAEAEAAVVHILTEFSFLTCTGQLFLVYAPSCTPITTVSNNSRIFYHQPSGFSQLFQTHVKFEDQWATFVFLYDSVSR